MIADLCKPLNQGESRTIRIIMSVDEVRQIVNSAGVLNANDVKHLHKLIKLDSDLERPDVVGQ